MTCTVSMTADATVTATFDVPPTVSIDAPADAAAYNANAVPAAHFKWTPDVNVRSCLATVDGTAVTKGGALPSTPGRHSITVVATASDGSSPVSLTHTYTVNPIAPPTARIIAPAANQVYSVGESVATRFSCADDPTGPGIRSCVDSGGAANGSGTLDTSTEGHHSYAVTANSRDGQSGKATIDYTVVGKAPEVVIAAPVENAAYLWGAVPSADFTCVAGIGSTVQSCQATVGGQKISDHQALPNAFGVHTLTVTATDADGLSTTAQATCTITSEIGSAPPVSVSVPGQGATYRLWAVGACALLLPGLVQRPRAGVMRGHREGGPCHQHQHRRRARAAASARGAPTASFQVTYTPTGGAPRAVRLRLRLTAVARARRSSRPTGHR